jgi:hypothetical protein
VAAPDKPPRRPGKRATAEPEKPLAYDDWPNGWVEHTPGADELAKRRTMISGCMADNGGGSEAWHETCTDQHVVAAAARMAADHVQDAPPARTMRAERSSRMRAPSFDTAAVDDVSNGAVEVGSRACGADARAVTGDPRDPG